ncbi:hypothetical protein ABE236_18140 [Priestia endophytica]|uniref:hypothetical protein n=1 Tax=Priestia endophytica TaxID=135735 RepID=UPI003D2C6283
MYERIKYQEYIEGLKEIHKEDNIRELGYKVKRMYYLMKSKYEYDDLDENGKIEVKAIIESLTFDLQILERYGTEKLKYIKGQEDVSKMTQSMQNAMEVINRKRNRVTLDELQFFLTVLRDHAEYDDVYNYLERVLRGA